jgi:uncharacterized membrane protein
MSPRADPRLDEPPFVGRRALHLLGPFVFTGGVLVLVWLVSGVWTLNAMLVAGGLSLMGAGTTVVFGEAALGDRTWHLHLTTWQLAYVVMYVNAVSAWFYTWNLDLLQRLPRIGPVLLRARRNARRMLRHRPWIRRWTVVGVALFVISPLPGSGALGGSFVGRIAGVGRRATLLAVSVAGVVVASGYALLAGPMKTLLDRVQDVAPYWVRLAAFALSALLLLGLVALLVRWFAAQPATAGAPDRSPPRR